MIAPIRNSQLKTALHIEESIVIPFFQDTWLAALKKTKRPANHTKTPSLRLKKDIESLLNQKAACVGMTNQ